ncbi:MAG: ABC transporter permease [Planctomycetota bacterium]
MSGTGSAANRVIVYDASARRVTPFGAVARACDELSRSWYVMWRLFLRGFLSQFRQRVLGYAWAVIMPVLAVISFVFLYYAGLLQPGETGVPYPVYVLVGTTIWGVLANAVTAVGGSLQAHSDLVVRTNIPRLSLALSALGTVLYGTLASMIAMGVVFLVFRTMPTPMFALYPLLVLPFVLIGAAIGLVLSVVSVIAKDATAIATQALTLLMYATPVVFVSATVEQELVRAVIEWNPLSAVIELPRSLILGEGPRPVGMYLACTGGAVVLLGVCLWFFYVLDDLVAERL